MHKLRLPSKEGKLSILCLGAHCDDIEIGCGGTILRLLDKHKNVHVCWFIFSNSGSSIRDREGRASAEEFLANAEHDIILRDYRDGFLPFIGDRIKDEFEQLKAEVTPDIIFTPYREDLHQDHRTVSELTWNTFRDHLILEYEIPKYDGGLGSPNFFVSLDEKICNCKVEYLIKHFESQRSKQWFTEDLFFSMLRIRGVECNSPSNYAEAFYNRKLII